MRPKKPRRIRLGAAIVIATILAGVLPGDGLL